MQTRMNSSKRIMRCKITNIREYIKSDKYLLREMLYEAVYWRENPNKPSLQEAMADPEIYKAIDSLNQKDGDAVMVAEIDSRPVGAAWYRYWTEDNNIRGFIADDIPVIVVGVHKNYRRMGIGKMLMERLIRNASESSISKLSLCVSKDNHAVHLYRKTGFAEYKDIGDSLLMVRDV